MTTRTLKTWLAKAFTGALLAATLVTAAGPAWADRDDHDRGRGHEWHEHEIRAYNWHRVYPHARIIYAPPVVVAPPPPVYYYEPAPVYYEPPPSGISLIFPLHFN